MDGCEGVDGCEDVSNGAVKGKEGVRGTLMLVFVDGVVHVFWVFKIIADHDGGLEDWPPWC